MAYDDVLKLLDDKIREADNFGARDQSEWCFELSDIRKIRAALTRFPSALQEDGEVERLREALEFLLASCTSTTPALHDDCGTRIVTAPSVEALKKARAALKEQSHGDE